MTKVSKEVFDVGLFKRLLTFIKPYNHIFGITLISVFGLAIFGAIRPKVLQLAIDDNIAAKFDVGFLDGELSLIRKDKINRKFVIDSLEVARNKFPGTSNSLDALCRKFNIDLSRRSKHNALLDCELLREVYINLLDVKEPKLNLSNTISEQNIADASDYNKKIVMITEVELKKHKEFLKIELKKNFY